MPDLEYFIVSESISIYQLTNRVSLFHIFEEIRSPTAPFFIPELVASVRRKNALSFELKGKLW